MLSPKSHSICQSNQKSNKNDHKLFLCGVAETLLSFLCLWKWKKVKRIVMCIAHNTRYSAPFLGCTEDTAFCTLNILEFFDSHPSSWWILIHSEFFISPCFSINKTFKRRWFVLGCFCLLSMGNAITWITFAPISDKTEKQFGISTLWVSVWTLHFVPPVHYTLPLLNNLTLFVCLFVFLLWTRSTCWALCSCLSMCHWIFPLVGRLTKLIYTLG